MTASAKAAAKAQAAAEIAANVHTAFRQLVEAPYANGARPTREALGSTERSKECSEFVPAAHQWGLLHAKASEQVRMEMLLQPRGLTAAATTLLKAQGNSTEAEKTAYTAGYTLWFLCARAPRPLVATDARPTPAQTELRPYTVAAGEEGPGAGAGRYRDQPPSTAIDLTRQAWAALRHHEEVLEPRRRNAEAASRAARLLAASAPAPAASASASASAGAGSSSSSARPTPYARPTPAPRRALGPAVLPPDAAAALDAEPAPVTSTAKAMALFLQAPRSRLAFGADGREALHQQIYRDVLTDDRVLRVVRRKDGEQLLPPAVEFLRGEDADGNVVDWLGATLAERFVGPFGLHELFKETPVQGTNHHTAPKPDAFKKQLGLRFKGRGSYNSVWTADGSKNAEHYAATLGAMPKQMASDLAGGQTVLRVPAASNWGSLEDVGAEMFNMAEAALHGYGPLVAAMWVVRAHETRGDERRPVFKLFTIMAKGQMDLQTRMASAKWLTAPLLVVDKLAKAYLHSLRLCLWSFSVRGCVHTDAKLSNFIDMCPSEVTETTKIATTAIRVIDMDAGVFRRLERIVSAAESHQGWRPVWLHNVLFVSCFLKPQLPEPIFMELWWRPLSAAVAHTMGLLAREDAALRADADFELARRFVFASRWAHGFHLGQQLPAAPVGGAPEAIGRSAVLMAVYYFHDVWERAAHDRYGNHAKAYRAASRATAEAPPGTPLRAQREAEQQAAFARWNVARGWFDNTYRVQAPAQFRYFADRMEPHDERGAPTLVAVMHDYVATPMKELVARYVDGRPAPGAGAAVGRWPPMSRSADHDRVDWDDPRQTQSVYGFRA